MSRNDVPVVKGHLLYFSTNYSLTFQSSVYDRCIFNRFRFHADQSCRNRPEPFLAGAWILEEWAAWGCYAVSRRHEY